MRILLAILIIGGCIWACTTPSIVATQAIQLGDAMNNQSKYDLAIKHYEEYLEVSPQLGHYRNPSQEAQVCRKLAYAYATQGKYSKGLEYIQKALTIDNQIENNQVALIEDWRLSGLIKAYRGKYQEGIADLNTSVEMSEGLSSSAKDIKRKPLGETYLSLAQINLTLGNYNEANLQTEKALNVFQSLQNADAEIMECKLLLGLIAREKGILDESLRWVEESRELAHLSRTNTSRHDQAIGEIHFLKGEYEDGIRFKLSALEQAEQSKIKPQIIHANMRLGDAFMQLGDKDQANQYFLKAWELENEIRDDSSFNAALRMRLGDTENSMNYYVQSGSSVGAGLASLKMGQIYIQRQNWDSAQSLLLKSKEFFNKSESNEGVAKVNIAMASVLHHQASLTELVDLMIQTRKLTIQPDLIWQTWYYQGIAYEMQSDYENAKDAYSSAIVVIDEMRGNLSLDEFKALFANSKVDVYDRMINLLLQNYIKLNMSIDEATQQSFLFNEQSRSRAFLDMIGNRKIEPKSIKDDALLEEEQLLRLKIQQLHRELDSDLMADHLSLSNELNQTQESYDQVLQQIKLANPAYGSVSSIQPPTISDLQKKLKQNEVIIEYWVSENKLTAWVITHENVKSHTSSVSRKELTRYISLARRSISLRLSDQRTESLSELYKRLIQPLLPDLKSKDHLIIIPHRALHFLPFQSLLSASGKYLVENFIVSASPSSAIWHYCGTVQHATNNKFLGMALGELELAGAPSLPGTKMEVEQISRTQSSFESFDEHEFTETRLKSKAPDFDYIHLATHGVFNERQPLYSYLLMQSTEQDDGRLTVGEIMSMHIQSQFVTLSACETGLGELSEGDDLIGMSRAFIYAGTPQVIVSLWKVDDATTAWLMTRFYQYVQSGKPASTSLALAQRDILSRHPSIGEDGSLKQVEMNRQIELAIKDKDQNERRDPYLWAPFVVIGRN